MQPSGQEMDKPTAKHKGNFRKASGTQSRNTRSILKICNNSRSMWNSTKAMTAYKTNKRLQDDDATWPVVLNWFCSYFDTRRGEAAPVIEPADDEPHTL